jgi:hypothetical protein
MAVMIMGQLEGMTAETYDALNTEMNFPDEPLDGLLSHAAGPTVDGFQIVDVWESQEKFTSFVEGKLLPALGAVGYEAGPPSMDVVEVHDRWPS